MASRERTIEMYARALKCRITPETKQKRIDNASKTADLVKLLYAELEIKKQDEAMLEEATRRIVAGSNRCYAIKQQISDYNTGSCFECGIFGGHPINYACKDGASIAHNLSVMHSEEELFNKHFRASNINMSQFAEKVSTTIAETTQVCDKCMTTRSTEDKEIAKLAVEKCNALLIAYIKEFGGRIPIDNLVKLHLTIEFLCEFLVTAEKL